MNNGISFRWGIPELDTQYTIFPNFMFRYYAKAGVARDEFLLIQHLATYRYEDPDAKDPFPGEQRLAEEMGYSHHNSIARLIKRLEGRGLLIVARRPGLTSIYNFAGFARKVYDLWQADLINEPPHASVLPHASVSHARVIEEDVDDDNKRPHIFFLYESVLGLMVRSIYEADRLKDIEETYPIDWIEAAFKMAIDKGATSRLAYAEGILKDWQTRGRDAPKREKEIKLFDEHRTVFR